MAPATDIRACAAFATAVAAAGGTVPDVLANILSSYKTLQAPVRPASPEIDAIMDAALAGKLDQKTLDKLLPPAAIAAMTNRFRAEFARDSEHTLVASFIASSTVTVPIRFWPA